MGSIALDTNAYSAFMRGDASVLEEMGRADTIYLPLFVIGELHYGFRGGNRLLENLDQLSRFLAKPTVRQSLPDLETAEIYGETQDRLKRAGIPIPTNDLWIASSCMQTGSKLISYDRHFKNIAGLRLWNQATQSVD